MNPLLGMSAPPLATNLRNSLMAAPIQSLALKGCSADWTADRLPLGARTVSLQVAQSSTSSRLVWCSTINAEHTASDPVIYYFFFAFLGARNRCQAHGSTAAAWECILRHERHTCEA